MADWNEQTTIGRVVAERPYLAATLEKVGIDYCCGGGMTIKEASQGKGLDHATFIQMLDAVQPGTVGEGPDCDSMSLTELVDHIEATHHVFMKENLPRLDGLTQKVAEVHGENHPELKALRDVYLGLKDEIEQHLMKEEQVLFPFLRELDGAKSMPDFHCGSVRNPIYVMEQEHEDAGRALARMRALADNYTVPDDGCASYKTLYEGLAAMEYDLHQHIHKENYILFPKAIEKEDAIGG